MHGPGWPGPARSPPGPWAGPGLKKILVGRAGPGLDFLMAGRAGPGLDKFCVHKLSKNSHNSLVMFIFCLKQLFYVIIYGFRTK